MKKFIEELHLTGISRKTSPTAFKVECGDDYNCAGGWGQCSDCGDDPD